ncbi:hypothetical protein BDA96_01G302800 [Sorghum bicolor]|uniref:VQ domain-containing protein n=2 Tax=Sorghum bicolor TaxID=4558 RepID=A0A921S275_SORBI|nr:hypothetical protein BDA96_01G302800 [Sorghum bicolor]KXG38786.1 hypothetical protein SORBI_3001G279500 [Sorghum bicolor]
MESSKNKQQRQSVDAASGSKPAAAGARPHWRRRDPADTAVYVVQPDQFRAVVQQLTGAASSPPPPPARQHQGGHGTAAAAAAGRGGTSTNAAAAQREHGGGRTLGQIQQEVMAWANSDDDD